MEPQSQTIFYALLRSYISLAKTLNLSQTVRDLKSTRQTVRRHISLLEQQKGVALFYLKDREYKLTEDGRNSLQEAENLLARADLWISNQSDHINGLAHLAFAPKRSGSGFYYYLQQHPLGRLWQDGSALMQTAFQLWAQAKGEIENPAFAKIRPYLMVFRQHGDDWICADIGEKSSFATWHGWEKQRSSIGCEINELPGGIDIAKLLTHQFKDVMTHQCLRLDHVFTLGKVADHSDPVPISYQRLILGCRFPDGGLALACLVDRTRNISILGLDHKLAQSMPKEFIMNVDVD